MLLTTDLLYHIAIFLDWPDIHALLSISKRYSLSRPRIPRSIRTIYSVFSATSHLPHSMFGFWSRSHFIRLPILHLGARCGSTDYIDFVTLADMGCYQIMRGIDILNRNFISVRHERYIFTFFQRYSTNPLLWTVGGHVPSQYRISCFRFGTNPDEHNRPLVDFLTNLIQNG